METRSRADFLHWSLEGAHVLFSSFSLNTFGDFVLGSLLAVAICLSERYVYSSPWSASVLLTCLTFPVNLELNSRVRFITFALSKRWSPSFVGRSQWRQALWRAQLFWVVSLLRLCVAYHLPYLPHSHAIHSGRTC